MSMTNMLSAPLSKVLGPSPVHQLALTQSPTGMGPAPLQEGILPRTEPLEQLIPPLVPRVLDVAPESVTNKILSITATNKPQIVADQNYKPTLMNLLRSAKTSIDIVHFNFYSENGDVRDIFNMLIQKAREGVAIRLFLEADHGEVGVRNKATIVRFHEEMIRIKREEGLDLNIQITEDSKEILTHTKAVCVDQEILFFGSTNWSNTSIGKNNETNVLLRSPQIAAAFNRYFEKLITHPEELATELTNFGDTVFYTDAAHFQDLRKMAQTAKTSLDGAMYFFRPISASAKTALKGHLPSGKTMFDVMKDIVTELASGRDVREYLSGFITDERTIEGVMRAIAADDRTRLLMDDFSEAVTERGVVIKLMLEDNNGSFGADVEEANRLAEIYMREKIRSAGGKQDKLKIYFENPDKISHSKYLIQDGEIVMMGTSNWFVGDLFRNHNMNLRLADKDFAKELRTHHLQKIAYETQRVRGLPVIRFWLGYPDPSTNQKYFVKGLQKILIPDTTGVGAERGLIGYFPTILQMSDGSVIETAKVIYADEETYDAIRATPEGERYGREHFQVEGVSHIPGLEDMEGRKLFSRDLGDGRRSGSAVAEIFSGIVQYGKAYTLVPDKKMNWQEGTTAVRISYRRPGIDDETYQKDVAAYLAKRQSAKESLSHVVRVEKDFIIEYIVADDETARDEALAALEKSAAAAVLATEKPINVSHLSDETSQMGEFIPVDENGNMVLSDVDGPGRGFQVIFVADFVSLIRDE